jgi:hypothetical protein
MYQVQTNFPCKFHANQLTKVTKKILKKIIDVLHYILYHSIKFQVQIQHILRDKKIENCNKFETLKFYKVVE